MGTRLVLIFFLKKKVLKAVVFIRAENIIFLKKIFEVLWELFFLEYFNLEVSAWLVAVQVWEDENRVSVACPVTSS